MITNGYGDQSPSRTYKIECFQGSLPERDLYIYLPPGYDDLPKQRYPVLYMHDGQNVFTAFEEESHVGSWRVDETADRLIEAGAMRPAIIVGVGNGGDERIAEYLPPYSKLPAMHKPRRERSGVRPRKPLRRGVGRADRTLAYYRDEVAPFIESQLCVLPGREHRATAGSSMGGLFSLYIAWEHSDWARHHAALSPSLWITRRAPSGWAGPFEAIERLRSHPRRDVRLWIDSGSERDGAALVHEAVHALRTSGYREGEAFQHYLHQGADHSESHWGTRMELILAFLFPPVPEPVDEGELVFAAGEISTA